MQERALGRQGLTTSVIGYGAMRIALGDDESTDSASIAAIRRAYDDGVTHFDTAELYGWGRGEKLLGRALGPVRDQVTIATKFGFEFPLRPNSQLGHVREVVDNSLRNLGVDHIDVLYQHLHDPTVPVEEVVGVMKEYVDAGKVKYLGLSNTTLENVRKAHAVHPISVLQTEYSIFSRQSEAAFPVLEELEIGVVAFSPLARGFLSGTITPREAFDEGDFRRNSPWWSPRNFDANTRIVEQLTRLAESKGATLSQLSLAWLVARKPYIVPIPGSGNAERVAQNNLAAKLELSADDLALIDQIAPNGGHAH
ncbi:aldo/keto reductase [Streptomyces sp. NPDC020898]|uniref:aldo/keto reductase n=1 Tax=Streptomyces sp. NPDC020898 TaxID=3365101 RepID=UPI0037AD9579